MGAIEDILAGNFDYSRLGSTPSIPAAPRVSIPTPILPPPSYDLTPAPEVDEPSWPMKALRGVGAVVGAPKAGMDYLVRQAAADGNAEAGRTLALALIQGRALPKNSDEGMQLLESASDAGDRSATLLLGKLLLRGEDVEQDLDRQVASLAEALDVAPFVDR